MEKVYLDHGDNHDAGPLTPSRVFDNLGEYKILGRGTCNPLVVVDDTSGFEISHFAFSITDMHFEIAKRDFVGKPTLFAAIVLEDLQKNRQCNCHEPDSRYAHTPLPEVVPVPAV